MKMKLNKQKKTMNKLFNDFHNKYKGLGIKLHVRKKILKNRLIE
jgi:hypothetical protein